MKETEGENITKERMRRKKFSCDEYGTKKERLRGTDNEIEN
jgi:hypothetical protein